MRELTSSASIKVRVPVNFDAVSLAQRHYKSQSSVSLLADRLNWFVSQVISVGLRQDKRKVLENTGFVTLSTEVLTEVFLSSSTTNQVIKALDGVVIDRNESYQTNNYSKGYRLRPEYLTVGLKSVEITSYKMRRIIHKRWIKKSQEQADRLQSVSALVAFIKDKDLKIDLKKAHGFLEFWAFDLKGKLAELRPHLDPDLVQELSHRVMTKLYYQKELLRRIEAGEVKPIRDESGLRLHSAYTGLKSPLRNLLTYQGLELISVDLKASQPYLFTRLLHPDFWKKSGGLIPSPHTLSSLHPDLHTSLSRTGVLDDIIMFTESGKTQAGGGLQGFSFSEIPWEHDYYKLLMEQTKIDFTAKKKVLNCYKNRRHTKFHNMLLFFDTKVTGRESYRVPFRAYFPAVLDLMDFIRKIPGVPTKRQKRAVRTMKNNNLPILLQRLESRLVLDEICPAILNDHPNLFLLTVHDSIITVKGQEHIVVDYMTRILESRIGAKPGLKVETLHPANVDADWQKFIQDEWDEMISELKKRKRKTGSELASIEIQKMLEGIGKLAVDPLLRNQIPELGDRSLFSTRYVDVDDFMDDCWPDEFE